MKKKEEATCKHHDHKHHGHHIHPITDNLKVAFFLNLSFTIIEFIGGFFTNSIAILSDAVHDLGDTMAIGSALFFESYSDKQQDRSYNYGYKRFSILSALITSVILFTGSIIIIISTIPRLLNPEPVYAEGVIWLAVLGVVINGLAVLKLRNNSHSLNQRAVMLHLLEDALGWIAVLIGSIVMYFTNWTIIDPILSLAIACFILFNVFKNLKGIFHIFLQAVPNSINEDDIEQELQNIGGVKGVHELRIWTIDGHEHVASVHLVVIPDVSLEQYTDIRRQAKDLLKTFHIVHATIEIEHQGECVE